MEKNKKNKKEKHLFSYTNLDQDKLRPVMIWNNKEMLNWKGDDNETGRCIVFVCSSKI